MRPLLAVHGTPATDPTAWAAAACLGPGGTAVVHAGAGDALAGLAAAGVPMLGYVDLDHAGRPLAAILADVRRWADFPVQGVFFNHAPTSSLSAGPVALALRVAQRARLPEVTLNPGAPPEPLYRTLGARICVFDGDWTDYVRWSGDGAQPGDGHLIYAVPAGEVPAARRLAAARGAGFGLVTDAPRHCSAEGQPCCA
jgi:hypothetical protein